MVVSPEKRYNVHFEPDNVDITIEPGANLMETAIAAGVHINASCGGAGVCGTCNVLVKKGKVESTRMVKVSEREYARGVRQSCQSRIMSDLVVEIPVESRLEKAIFAREELEMMAKMPVPLATRWQFKPPVSKHYLVSPPPTLKDNTSDLSRLLRCLKQQCKLDKISVDFGVVRKLTQVLRDGNWKTTVTILLDEPALRLINIELGDTRASNYSLAFDIGTTSIRGQLLDLNRGRVMAQSTDYNRQVSYGEDVISRITWAQKTGGLKKLQRAAVATINSLITEIINKSGVEIKDINHIVVAANTVMVQLLLGLDPKYLRLSPYVPTANTIPLVKASSLGIGVEEHVHLYTIPSVASYVGGDIVAGVLGTGLYQRKKLTLYIDIGTNGEIVIGNSDWMVTASCSAGPTFEGGGIKHGMIATSGAIEGFDISPSTYEPVIYTIGNDKAKGICGSGLINIAAAMLKTGVIDQKGKFNSGLKTKSLRQGDDGYEYVLVWAPESQIGKDIVISEIDIENLIRSKAAMYAGCQTLIKSLGAKCPKIEQVIIAGTFGSNINIENAITIGLLPDLPRDRFIFIGNGSLLGARLTSFSTDLLNDGQMIAGMMTNLELSENADFMGNYMAALFLPHTNADEFPSVKAG